MGYKPGPDVKNHGRRHSLQAAFISYPLNALDPPPPENSISRPGQPLHGRRPASRDSIGLKFTYGLITFKQLHRPVSYAMVSPRHKATYRGPGLIDFRHNS